MKQMSSEMHTRIFNKLLKAKAKMRGSYQKKKLKCADKYIINVHNVIAEVLNQHYIKRFYTMIQNILSSKRLPQIPC